MSESWQQRSPLVVLDEFLVAQEWASLLRFTLHHRDRFTHSGVLDAGGNDRNDQSYRRSQVLYDLGPADDMFADRIMTYLPHVLARLHMPIFPVSRFEIQLTATNDGQFFRQHKDDDSDNVRTRVLTFVYYFYQEPKSFHGGELQLYDGELDQAANVTAGAYQLIHPSQNQIVFFPSDCLHEVLPVECPSRDFADSRFTVNGWLHR
ncbi:MAG TPA: 2OG-Fe(II) oxygenase [Acidobacteriaceae bacterium]|nr:2OG-Fe(II) oxygenase [Acidobacteriaceae bacterium]